LGKKGEGNASARGKLPLRQARVEAGSLEVTPEKGLESGRNVVGIHDVSCIRIGQTRRVVGVSAARAREVTDHRMIELAWTADLMRDPYIRLICASATYTE
jgi:hypothetical protein